MEISICKLSPKSPIHLGKKEGVLESTELILHSDTIFSAFCNVYRLIYGNDKLDDLITKFLNKPLFLISSGFPFKEDILLFPIPKNIIFKEKWKKRIKFIPKEIFENICKGEDINNYLKRENLCQDKVVILGEEKESFENIWYLENIPRVSIDSITSSSQIYHFGQVIYSTKSGIFFLIKYFDKKIKKEFETTMRVLADEGIGGDRSSGKGLFEIPRFLKIDLNVPESSDFFVNLSLYYPIKEEVFDIKDAYYELMERKGWVYSFGGRSMRRESVRMFNEGSVFKENKNIGKMVDITPSAFKEHNIYRYGYTFKIPYNIGRVK